jgi:nucleotide-binding universal stress UspA family protein
MGYNKILVPLAGSELSEKAIQHVLRVGNLGAEIHLLTVLSESKASEYAGLAVVAGQSIGRSSDVWKPALTASEQEEVRAAEEYLDRIGSELEQSGFKVITEVRPGSVVGTISLVSSDGYDVIIMATHRRTGFSKLLLGSVSEGVLHDASCPVLIV